MSLKPGEEYKLTKSLWTERDYDTMGWHDANIHAMAFEPEHFELIFDIDYIFAWVDPSPPSEGFSFWLSPATLVFHDAFKFEADVRDTIVTPAALQILDVTRHPNEDRDWTIKLDYGEMRFQAKGFSQFIRRKPAWHAGQRFSLTERGGFCFGRTACLV